MADEHEAATEPGSPSPAPPAPDPFGGFGTGDDSSTSAAGAGPSPAAEEAAARAAAGVPDNYAPSDIGGRRTAPSSTGTRRRGRQQNTSSEQSEAAVVKAPRIPTTADLHIDPDKLARALRPRNERRGLQPRMVRRGSLITVLCALVVFGITWIPFTVQVVSRILLQWQNTEAPVGVGLWIALIALIAYGGALLGVAWLFRPRKVAVEPEQPARRNRTIHVRPRPVVRRPELRPAGVEPDNEEPPPDSPAS